MEELSPVTICDHCYEAGKIVEAPETCIECGADMCPGHGEGEFCCACIQQERFAQGAPEPVPAPA
jgi:hypothetical protein